MFLTFVVKFFKIFFEVKYADEVKEVKYSQKRPPLLMYEGNQRIFVKLDFFTGYSHNKIQYYMR